MSSKIPEIDTKTILKSATRVAQARAVLASRPYNAMQALIASVATAFAVYAMSDFAAPMVVKILISCGFVGSMLSQIDAWFLQRRLDAVVDLLSQIEREDSEIA